jgi:hypothetical protein
MTLIPVSKISCSVPCSMKDGASRWIPRMCSLPAKHNMNQTLPYLVLKTTSRNRSKWVENSRGQHITSWSSIENKTKSRVNQRQTGDWCIHTNRCKHWCKEKSWHLKEIDLLMSPRSSMASPMTLIIRPNVARPTGTCTMGHVTELPGFWIFSKRTHLIDFISKEEKCKRKTEGGIPSSWNNAAFSWFLQLLGVDPW